MLMRGKYRMRSCSRRNLLHSVGNVNPTQKRHIVRISIFAAGDNTFNCFYPELDLWDGASSQDAKNKSISPPTWQAPSSMIYTLTSISSPKHNHSN